MMGNPDMSGSLPELRDLTRETGIRLLDRGAEVGLLMGASNGYYFIHPALPWFFNNLFEQEYSDGSEYWRETYVGAFVNALSFFGSFYFMRYSEGQREVISVLTAEESNLLYARKLAREHGWWDEVVRCMQGLQMLYNHTGRSAEWERLVNEIVPDFIDVETESPLERRGKTGPSFRGIA